MERDQTTAINVLKSGLLSADVGGRRSPAIKSGESSHIMELKYRPVWPPYNRILVDSGNATVNDRSAGRKC